MRASTMVGVSATSAARRALRVVMCCWVGISTLPPMWPHFLAELSWSSQWTPAAPDSIMPFMGS